jgi:outer membrane murein-binding lipoprotein Lpp
VETTTEKEEELRSELEDLRERHEALNAEGEALRSEVRALTSWPDRAKEKEAELQELMNRHEALAAEARGLRSEAEGLREKAVQIQDLTEKNQALGSEAEGMRKEIEGLRAGSKDLEATKWELIDKNDGLEAEVKQLHSKIDLLETSHAKEAESWERTVEGLKTETQDLRSQVEGLETEKKELSEKLESFGKRQSNASKPRVKIAEEADHDMFNIVNMPRFEKEKLIDVSHMREVLLELLPKHDIKPGGEAAWPAQVQQIMNELWRLHNLDPWPSVPAAVLSTKYHEVKQARNRKDFKGLDVDELADFAFMMYEYLSKSMHAETRKRASRAGARGTLVSFGGFQASDLAEVRRRSGQMTGGYPAGPPRQG